MFLFVSEKLNKQSRNLANTIWDTSKHTIQKKARTMNAVLPENMKHPLSMTSVRVRNKHIFLHSNRKIGHKFTKQLFKKLSKPLYHSGSNNSIYIVQSPKQIYGNKQVNQIIECGLYVSEISCQALIWYQRFIIEPENCCYISYIYLKYIFLTFKRKCPFLMIYCPQHKQYHPWF